MNFENYEVGIKNCLKNNCGGRKLVYILKQASGDWEIDGTQFTALLKAAMQSKYASTVQWFLENTGF